MIDIMHEFIGQLTLPSIHPLFYVTISVHVNGVDWKSSRPLIAAKFGNQH